MVHKTSGLQDGGVHKTAGFTRPLVGAGMMKKMMENMSQVMSPDLLSLASNPELQQLKSRPERLFGPGVNGAPVEAGGLGDAWKRWKVIYPEYLDSRLTCREGRRLQQEACVPDVSIQDVLRALAQLDFPYVFENKRYPRRVYADGGRVKVGFAGTRTELYLAVAVAIMINRQQEEETAVGDQGQPPALTQTSHLPSTTVDQQRLDQQRTDQQRTDQQQGASARQHPDGTGPPKKRYDTRKKKGTKRTDR
ncbi:signal recognition particle 19 kDa protein [Gregarina niphandrodes]|uniref:Signal recognition particle 19 kDa protein n=1 Tax=Gregarina niphandrodes TaxID=110365 RepID=A0A023AYG5_GRENI|nr:signal recognition particle 19 kDa protein [Gregarina niphandrodes]EZG43689.1 signal recognition particle 19 kDa protein [Gregarina niphandrodes]|eukprot:XP_011133079.1 signal recognition particle 19 kDa protein [Gregarina niphandrodes]